ANAITVGRTKFSISMSGDALVLRPASHVALFDRSQADLPQAVSWSWQRRAPWRMDLPSGWAVFAAIALAVAALSGWSADRTDGRRSFISGAAGALIASAGVAALVLQRLGSAPGTGWMLLIA